MPTSLIDESLLEQICLGTYFPNGYEIRQIANELKSKRMILSTRIPKNIVVVSPTVRPA